MKPKWYERTLDAFLNFLLLGMPWIAASVIGSSVTWFNVTELHHRLWLSLLYGFGVPLLLLGFHNLMYKDSPGARCEVGFLLGLAWLISFLMLWPLFIKIIHRIKKPGAGADTSFISPKTNCSPAQAICDRNSYRAIVTAELDQVAVRQR